MNENDIFENREMNFQNESAVCEMLPSTGEGLRAARKRFSVIGLGFALYTAISLVVALVIQIAAIIIDPQIVENILFLNVVTPVSLYVFALPVLLLVLYLFGAKGEAPEKKKMGILSLPLIFLVSFGLMYLGSFVGQGVMWGFTQAVGYDYANALESMIDNDSMWITVVFMCIVAPIGEEFVFRKLIIDRTHKYGGFVSILFSGLLFGLMHANFYQFFYAFALGLVLGYVYYSTGNIWYGIGLHAAINFVGSVLVSYLDAAVTEMTYAMIGVDMQSIDASLAFYEEYGLILVAEYGFFLLVIASMISAIVLPIVFRNEIVLERKLPMLPRGKTLGAAFLNVGVILLLLVYIFEFIISLIPPAAG